MEQPMAFVVRQGRNTRRRREIQSVHSSGADFDQAYLNLAQLYMLFNERAKAREVLQSLLRCSRAQNRAADFGNAKLSYPALTKVGVRGKS